MIEVRIGDVEAQLTWDEWEDWVRKGRVPPDAQVRSDALTNGAFVRADALESYADLLAEGERVQRAAELASKPPIVTALLVGLQVRIWWFSAFPLVEGLIVRDGLNYASPILEDGESWRLLSMGLLHLDTGHILLNMLWLAYTGAAIERSLGRINLVTLYTGSVLGGSLLSMLFKPETSSLGASGGVFGLIAAVVVYGLTHPDRLHSSTRRFFGVAMLPYLVIMFASGLSSATTDNWAHGGGLLTGLVLGLLVRSPASEVGRRRNKAVAGLVAGAVAACLVALSVAGPHLEVLADSEVARRRQPGLRAALPSDPEGYRALTYDVPLGWRVSALDSGSVGFVSPSPRARTRGWSVQERNGAATASASEGLAAFQSSLERAFGEVSVISTQPAEVAGLPALHAELAASGRHIDWYGIERGKQLLSVLWEVSDEDASRLAPLRDRLVASVEWPVPLELSDARAELEQFPDSRSSQRKLARAEAQYGSVARAAELYEALLADDPSDATAWTERLELAVSEPLATRHALYDRALAGSPTAEMAATVATQLREADEDQAAVGLAELAALQWPGDRGLRRVLRRLDRPSETRANENFPAWRVDERERRIDPVANPALPELPLTVAAAQAEGARIDSVWTAACEAVAAQSGDAEAVGSGVIALQLGYRPEVYDLRHIDAASRAVYRASDAERRPRWMCEVLADGLDVEGVLTWLESQRPPQEP